MRLGGNVVRAALLAELVGLALGGGISGIAGMAAFVGVLLPVKPGRALPAHILALIALLGLTLAGYAQDGLGVLVCWLLVHRVWTGEGRGDARLALLFGTLLLLLGCLRTESPLMAPVLLAVALMLPAALLRVEVGDGFAFGARSVITGASVVAIAAGLFAVLPRLNAGYLSTASGGASGNQVLLGDDAQSPRDDQAIVMHVAARTLDGAPIPGPFYLRGRSMDRFDGTRWSATLPAGAAPDPTTADAQAEVRLEPALGGIAFGPFETVEIEGLGTLLSDGGGTFFHREGAKPTRYLARFRHQREATLSLRPQVRQVLLQTPALDPRLTDLAERLAEGQTDPVAIAERMSAYLAQNLNYEAAPPSPTGDALAWFVFERKSGHCEYFASALAMMLRSEGIPARLGTGYWSGELDETGTQIVVRAAHAHAWVEIPTATGWQIVDPSPADGLPEMDPPGLIAWVSRLQDRWSRWVVEYDLGDQSQGLEAIGRGTAAALGQPAPQWAAGTGLVVTVVSLGAGYLIAVLVQFASGVAVMRPRRRVDALGRIAQRVRRRLRRAGVNAPDVPLGLLAGRLTPAAAEHLTALCDAIYAGKYGGADPVEMLRRATASERALTKALAA